MASKEELRIQMRALRDGLSRDRRSAASEAACAQLPLSLPPNGYVLSYVAIGSELDLNPLNRWLAQQKRLALPRVETNGLRLYIVTQLDKQLERSRWGLQEPIQGVCQEISANLLACALVPGLAFDDKGHRLGYGKAYFDRLLSGIPDTLAFGVGFTEQKLNEVIPSEPHDHPLSTLYLF